MSQPRRVAQSASLFRRASQSLVGGVSSPVRAFAGVGGEPLMMARGEGARIYDVDDNPYIDYVMSYGPLLLGHAPRQVLEAIGQASARGTTFGATALPEVLLAEQVKALVPSVEKLRFVSSGTEATMSAVRLARGATGRAHVLKFAGGYHGHADLFLVDEAGSGLATAGVPGSAGVTAGATQNTVTVPYNDLAAASEVVRGLGSQLAAIIVEPIACNMGLVPPAEGFLSGLRALCDASGAQLIFDEVITGFRVSKHGAQGPGQVRPDLTTFGKILGGGLPVGAYGGRAALMDHVAPLGPVYQAGTLSGNPVAMAAGLAMLETLANDANGVFDHLEAMGARMQAGVEAVLERHGRPARLSRIGSLFHLWFAADANGPPRHYDDIKRADRGRYARVFAALLEQGVSLAPSAFEVGFLSTAHGEQEVDDTVAALDVALAA